MSNSLDSLKTPADQCVIHSVQHTRTLTCVSVTVVYVVNSSVKCVVFVTDTTPYEQIQEVMIKLC